MTDPQNSTRSDLTPLLVLVAAKLLLHLAVNLWAGYGIFRDELYYLACADHLAWGYVDQPPLSIFLLAASRLVFGDSLFAIRLLPAVVGAGVVLLTGLLTRELGGGRFAVVLAATGSMVAGSNLALSSVWSMNIFDLFFVALTAYLLARLVRTEHSRLWIAIGLILGLGLMNKIGVLWIGLGIFVGVVATRERRWLKTPWPWVAGGISLLFFVPYLLWNSAHDWSHLDFIESAVSGKYSGLSAWTFLSGQVVMQNPLTLPLWLAGLGWLMFATAGSRYRLLGVIWLTACLVLMANGHSKAEYLASTYAMLFAAGGVAWESLLARRNARVIAWSVVAAGIVFAPLAMPILPVPTYVRYADAIGMSPRTDEGLELDELNQFYADMFGWEEKAAAVAEVFGGLRDEEQARAVVFGGNYGRAGALEYFAEEYHLPPAIGNHNNYWIWGPGEATGEVVIVLGGESSDLDRWFESVELSGVASCEYCMPYERDLPIYVCRELLLPIAELWPLIKHYS